LGEGPLYQAFLQGEMDAECILPPGSYSLARVAGQAEAEAPMAAGPARAAARHQPVGETASDRDEGQGSNNWVLAGSRTVSGKPLLANDPHVPFGAVSIWHEIHLHGGSFQAAGVALVGMPVLIVGRNERVAWGITNNISSQRDLYQEKNDPSHPGC